MTTLTHDTPGTTSSASHGQSRGIVLALASATAFGLSGALATPLLKSGWSAGSAVLLRISIAAIVLVIPGIVALRRVPHARSVVRSNLGHLTAYGLVAVAGCQLAYFLAVGHLPVAVALLIEYTAPVAVVGWLWLRHSQRPSRTTLLGGLIAFGGLTLVLGIASGATFSLIGIAWALVAMIGVATYFVLSADTSRGLPPITLAAGGLVIGALALGVAGAVGLVPMHASSALVRYADRDVPAWVTLLALGFVTGAFAYVSGIAAARRLGSRLSSFLALTEVLAAVIFAWLLVGQVPTSLQILGGIAVVAGVIVVKLGEREVSSPDRVSVSQP